MSHSLRKAATVSALALAALGAGTTSAQAGQLTLNYSCKYPLVDKQPLVVDVTHNIPEEVQVNAVLDPFDIKVVARAGGNTSQAITTLNAQGIDGQAQAYASLHFPSGFVQGDLLVDMTIDRWLRPAGPVPSVLELTASGKTPAVVLDEVGQTDVRLDRIALNLRALKADGTPIIVKKLTSDFDGNPVPVDTTPEDFNVYCKQTPGESNLIQSINVVPKVDVDTTAPTQPVTELPRYDACTKKVTLSWKPSTDAGGSGLKGYEIVVNGQPKGVVSAATTSFVVDNVAPGGALNYSIVAVDNAGNKSTAATGLFAASDAQCGVVAPIDLQATGITDTSVTLAWKPGTGGQTPAGYNVYRNGTKINTSLVTGTTFAATGLTAGTSYTFSVAAVDAAGLESPKSTDLVAKTTGGGSGEETSTLNYALKGSTALKTLTTGTLPLTGGIKAEADFATGNFTADLTLNNTSGRLVSGGFLPITAKVGFVPMGKTTGKLIDATATTPQQIETNSKVRIKVLEVKLFGAIPLAGGNNCQTKSVSDITLKSTNAFDPFKGGSIAGTYKISDLNGCGALNGLVSPLTAGGGNTIKLDLTYKP